MKYFISIILITLLLAGCSGGTGISFEIPFEGEQKIACEHYADYLSQMSEGNFEEAFEYEDFTLWPTLNRERYLELRSTYPEFSSLLSKSKVIFTQCAKQPEWGIYGQKFTDAFIIAVEIEPTGELTAKEQIFADILADRDNVNVFVEIHGKPVFFPSVGPEVFLVDEAMKTYREYISIIKNKEYNRIFDYTPSAITKVESREQISQGWDVDEGHSVSEFADLTNIEPIIGHVVFEPSVHGVNYRWGVELYVMMNLEDIDETSTAELQQLIIDDWRQGVNSKVLLVPEEDSWKVSAENPLF